MSTKQSVYEGSDLESLIRRVIDEHGPARIRPPERRRTGGLFGFFAKEVYVVSVDDTAPRPPKPSAPPSAPPVATPAGAATPFAALVESTEDELQLSTSPPAPSTGAKQEFSDVLRRVASSLGEEPGTYRPPPRAPRPAAARAAPDPTPGRTPWPRAAARVAPEATPGRAPGLDTALADQLLAAGCPRGLVWRARESPSTTLEAFFAEQLPVAPLPTVAGSLVAVVGEARAVRRVARAAADDAGVAPGEISIVSPVAGERNAPPGSHARTPEEVAALAPGWRRDRVGVVAVHAPPLGGDQHWTRQVLSSMRPSCVWGVVEATTKLDDVRGWVAAIGGVDAFALREPATTASPAAILELGLPVARLGASAATPRLWASLVTALATRS